MISDVKRLLDNAQDDLTLLGVELPHDLPEQQSLVVKRISTYCQLMRHSSRGEYRDVDGILAIEQDLRLHSVVQGVFKRLQDGENWDCDVIIVGYFLCLMMFYGCFICVLLSF
jgi:hypothetical protein